MTDIPAKLCGTWTMEKPGVFRDNMMEIIDLSLSGPALTKSGMSPAQFAEFKQHMAASFKPVTLTITKDSYTINGEEPVWDAKIVKPAWWTFEMGKKMAATYNGHDIMVTDSAGAHRVDVLQPEMTHISPWHSDEMAQSLETRMKSMTAANPADQPKVDAALKAMTDEKNLYFVKGGMGSMETMLVVVLGLAVVWMLMNYKK